MQRSGHVFEDQWPNQLGDFGQLIAARLDGQQQPQEGRQQRAPIPSRHVASFLL